jgi:hypothetical protein
MKAKDVKIGETYTHTFAPNMTCKVLVKSRRTELKSNVTLFEIWEENDQDPDFVSARTLSTLE